MSAELGIGLDTQPRGKGITIGLRLAPVHVGSFSEIATDFDTLRPPFAVVVDIDGTLRSRAVGARKWSLEESCHTLQQIVKAGATEVVFWTANPFLREKFRQQLIDWVRDASSACGTTFHTGLGKHLIPIRRQKISRTLENLDRDIVVIGNTKKEGQFARWAAEQIATRGLSQRVEFYHIHRFK